MRIIGIWIVPLLALSACTTVQDTQKYVCDHKEQIVAIFNASCPIMADPFKPAPPAATPVPPVDLLPPPSK